MKKIFGYTLVVMMIFACKGETEQKPPPESGSSAKARTGKVTTLPTLPRDLHEKLYNETDFIDFIFHDFPFSMSQKEKPSIQMNISYISGESVESMPAACKPVARQFYQIEGEIILEADVYYGDSCNFYIFYEEGKPRYANQMTYNGIGFFQNVISQAMNASKQING